MILDRTDPCIVRIVVDGDAVAQIVGCPAGHSLRWYDRDWREPDATEIHRSEAQAITAAQARIEREPDLGRKQRAAIKAWRKAQGFVEEN